jgi:hypothetical protein
MILQKNRLSLIQGEPFKDFHFTALGIDLHQLARRQSISSKTLDQNLLIGLPAKLNKPSGYKIVSDKNLIDAGEPPYGGRYDLRVRSILTKMLASGQNCLHLRAKAPTFAPISSIVFGLKDVGISTKY